MKISELIALLQLEREDHGNLEVVVSTDINARRDPDHQKPVENVDVTTNKEILLS